MHLSELFLIFCIYNFVIFPSIYGFGKQTFFSKTKIKSFFGKLSKNSFQDFFFSFFPTLVGNKNQNNLIFYNNEKHSKVNIFLRFYLDIIAEQFLRLHIYIIHPCKFPMLDPNMHLLFNQTFILTIMIVLLLLICSPFVNKLF